jgi:hypothetical protein
MLLLSTATPIMLSFAGEEVTPVVVVVEAVEAVEQKVRLSIKFALTGDGVLDFSETSPPVDINSSGDDEDVRASLNDVDEV